MGHRCLNNTLAILLLCIMVLGCNTDDSENVASEEDSDGTLFDVASETSDYACVNLVTTKGEIVFAVDTVKAPPTVPVTF